MKIVINARLLNERKGGPYRGLVNTLDSLAAIDNENIYYVLLNGKNDFAYDFFSKKNFIKKVIPVRNKFLFDYIVLPLYSFISRRDIYYFPKTTFAPYIRGIKIPVFHDIIYFEDFSFREFKFFDNLHHKLMIPLSQRFAPVCISVSNFTAGRMEKLLGIKPDRIAVIKRGLENRFSILSDNGFKKQTAAKYNLRIPFLFFAGSLSPRKNALNIIKAFELIKDSIPHNIYFTAGDSWRDGDVFRYIQEKGLGNRIIRLGFVSEDELTALYNLADCCLYPSLYEGFGLPILEAQGCGCPLITSNSSSCPEVAGEGALFVDPNNPKEIADAAVKVISDKKLRKSLISKGLENVKKYSWNKIAEEHLELFRRVYADKYNKETRA